MPMEHAYQEFGAPLWIIFQVSGPQDPQYNSPSLTSRPARASSRGQPLKGGQGSLGTQPWPWGPMSARGLQDRWYRCAGKFSASLRDRCGKEEVGEDHGPGIWGRISLFRHFLQVTMKDLQAIPSSLTVSVVMEVQCQGRGLAHISFNDQPDQCRNRDVEIRCGPQGGKRGWNELRDWD